MNECRSGPFLGEENFTRTFGGGKRDLSRPLHTKKRGKGGWEGFVGEKSLTDEGGVSN